MTKFPVSSIRSEPAEEGFGAVLELTDYVGDTLRVIQWKSPLPGRCTHMFRLRDKDGTFRQHAVDLDLNQARALRDWLIQHVKDEA